MSFTLWTVNDVTVKVSERCKVLDTNFREMPKIAVFPCKDPLGYF